MLNVSCLFLVPNLVNRYLSLASTVESPSRLKLEELLVLKGWISITFVFVKQQPFVIRLPPR